MPFVCFVVKTHDSHGPKRSSDFRLDRAFRDFAKTLPSRPPVASTSAAGRVFDVPSVIADSELHCSRTQCFVTESATQIFCLILDDLHLLRLGILERVEPARGDDIRSPATHFGT